MERYMIPRELEGNDSYLFLLKELEKVDEKILEPLTGTDWPRDMPVITGGGITESIANLREFARHVDNPCHGGPGKKQSPGRY